VPHNPKEQRPRTISVHLHQNKAPNTSSNPSATIVSKIYIIWMNQKHKPHVRTPNTSRHTNNTNNIRTYHRNNQNTNPTRDTSNASNSNHKFRTLTNNKPHY
jgi:hypothetical protein